MRAFGSFHPAVLMLYFASVLTAAMFVSNPVISAAALLGAALFCVSVSGARRLAGVYLPLLLVFSLTNPFFSHNGATVLFYLGDYSFTLESLLYGAAAGVTIVSVMLWFKAYAHTVTSDKFLYLFGRLTPRLSLVLSTVLRYVPMFVRQAGRIASAQKTMGLYASGRRFARVRGALRTMSALVTWSLENAMDTAASMRARGYGQKGRSAYSLFRFTRRDGALLSLCAALTAAVLVCLSLGAGEFVYYPVVVAPARGAALYTLYAAYAALAFLPGLIALKEKAQWKYCASKI